jgi:hypothetical protein
MATAVVIRCRRAGRHPQRILRASQSGETRTVVRHGRQRRQGFWSVAFVAGLMLCACDVNGEAAPTPKSECRELTGFGTLVEVYAVKGVRLTTGAEYAWRSPQGDYFVAVNTALAGDEFEPAVWATDDLAHPTKILSADVWAQRYTTMPKAENNQYVRDGVLWARGCLPN